MNGKSDRDNVVAIRGRGRPRRPRLDLDALQAPPPVKVAHKNLVDRSVYEQATQELDYNPETGVFVWKSKHPKKARMKGKVAGYPNNLDQICVQIGRRKVYAHRLAWFFVHGDVPRCSVDHINRNTQDNRIANLRLATFSENCANRRSSRGKFLRGVQPTGSGTFAASICKHRKRVELGTYDTERQAHEAYLRAAQVLHGEFACNAKGRDD